MRPVGSAVPSTGISPNNLKTIQEGAKKFGYDVGVRPQGPISGFVKNGIAKGPDIKNKSMDGLIDELIGGKGPQGTIGHFKPDEAAVKKLVEGIKRPGSGIPPDRQAQMIKEIEGRVADRTREFAGPKVQQLIRDKQLAVTKGGVLIDTASGKPVVTDLDLWNLTKGGAPVTPGYEKAFVKWLEANGVPVTHGAHMNWVPQTPDEYKIFEKIVQGHGVGGKPIITVGADGTVGAASYVPPTP